MTVLIALATNALIAVAKLAAGAVSDSSAMLAEGSVPEVDAVIELLTMHIGSDEILLAARLDLADGLDSTAVEDVSSRIEQEIGHRHPDVTQDFLDATRASTRERLRARRLTNQRPGE